MRRRLVVLVMFFLVSGCIFGGDDGGAGLSAKMPAVATPELAMLGADLISPARERRPLEQPLVDASMATVEALYRATVEGPIVRGKPGDLASLLTLEALGKATGEDRATVFDEEVLSQSTRGLKGTVAARLRGLAGDDDKPMMVIAAIDWDVRSPDGKLRVHRTGELTLVPAFGGIVISAYQLHVDRTFA